MTPFSVGDAVVIARPTYKLERFRGRLAVVTQIIAIGKTCRVRISLCDRRRLGDYGDASFIVARGVLRAHQPKRIVKVKGDKPRASLFPTRPKLELL